MNLRKKLIDILTKKQDGIEVYLFGSIIQDKIINDIDIAIIYDKAKLTLEKAVDIRKEIRDKIEKLTEYKSDILLLSNEENLEIEFTLNVKTEKVF